MENIGKKFIAKFMCNFSKKVLYSLMWNSMELCAKERLNFTIKKHK